MREADRGVFIRRGRLTCHHRDVVHSVHLHLHPGRCLPALPVADDVAEVSHAVEVGIGHKADAPIVSQAGRAVLAGDQARDRQDLPVGGAVHIAVVGQQIGHVEIDRRVFRRQPALALRHRRVVDGGKLDRRRGAALQTVLIRHRVVKARGAMEVGLRVELHFACVE